MTRKRGKKGGETPKQSDKQQQETSATDTSVGPGQAGTQQNVQQPTPGAALSQEITPVPSAWGRSIPSSTASSTQQSTLPKPGSSHQAQPGSSFQQPQPKSAQQSKKGKSLKPTDRPLPELGTLEIAPSSLRKPPKRPVPAATLGRAIRLSANHFQVTVKKGTIYHYDIEVKETVTAVLRRKIVEQFIKSDPRLIASCPVYDGKKNIYTARRINSSSNVPLGKTEVAYTFREADRGDSSQRSFKIVLQPTGEVEIDLSALDTYLQNGTSVDIPSRAIMALETAMKYAAASRPNRIMIGSCLLTIPQKGQIVELGQGAEVYFGHFQSLRLTWTKTLNIDASQRAFMMSGKVHEIMAKMFSTYDRPMRIGQDLSPWQYEELHKKIKNLKISYPREKYTATVGCNGLSQKGANQETFECDGKTVSVQDYFERKLRVKLQYPHLRCVWVGSRDKKNYVPMELCTIPPGQEYRRKLTDIQTTSMIKNAATPADVRKRRIENAVRDMNFNQDKGFQDFGISVDCHMLQVTGRVLPAPTLVYGEQQSSRVDPKDGSWNMRNLKFVDAKSIGKFGVLNLASRVTEEQIGAFLNALSREGRATGMTFDSRNWAFSRNTNMNSLENDIRTGKSKFPDLHVLFVIINRKGDPAYDIVKKVGDLDLHLVTQCVQFKNVLGRQGPDPATMANICLKLNAKLGGVNNLILRDMRPDVLKEQVIIMGADVTHPGADEESGKPSIAAVVGSVDPRASQYCCEIRVQKSKQEYIEDMEGMVYNILKKYNQVTGVKSTGKPQRIIFFRDGVSEGQFAKILMHEVSAIQKACLRIQQDYKPPITFVVVQKRHHTRLFPNDKNDECGRGKNVPPGTVVDKSIVHPTEHDFYLVSHFGIQGTSRPTHYHVLWDDNDFSADEMQKLTYYLCHMFSRCTRSVSYPAPCYYSHLVAFRGRQYYDSLTQGGRRVGPAELQRHIDGCREMKFMFFV